jgi:hypothetical protein
MSAREEARATKRSEVVPRGERSAHTSGGTMRALVRLRLEDGECVELGYGALVGRSSVATLRLDDPRVSEAHALVSVRRGELVLCSLRRMLGVRGRPVQDVVLKPGMVIELAPGLFVEVVDVMRPERVLAMEVEGLGRWVLPEAASLHVGPPPMAVPRFEPDAALHVWWNGDAWRARARGRDVGEVGAGDVVSLDTVDVRFVEVDLPSSATTPSQGPLEAPLRIVAWYDGVEIHREGREPVTFGGVTARILSELVVLAGPVEWHVVAKEVWRESIDVLELRHRWDVSLGRLRARLRDAGLRSDRVRADGGGRVFFVRHAHDRIEDRT